MHINMSKTTHLGEIHPHTHTGAHARGRTPAHGVFSYVMYVYMSITLILQRKTLLTGLLKRYSNATQTLLKIRWKENFQFSRIGG